MSDFVDRSQAGEIPVPGGKFYVAGITLVATLGGLLFGYDTAVISGAIGYLKSHFELTGAEMGWAASSALVGSFAGAALAGWLSLTLGRKKTLLLAALLFAISAIGTALPQSLTELVIYRIIGGAGVGIASMTSPMYIAEIAPANIRGRLVSFYQLAIVIGILVVYFVNYMISGQGDESWNLDLGWRWMFGSEAIPATLFFILLFFVPESPRWLAIKNRWDESLKVLIKIGGEKLAKFELEEIKESLRVKPNSSQISIFTPGILLVVIIGIVISIFQQATGINVILYYGPEIFKTMGSNMDAALIQTIIVGAVNLLFTVVAILFIDRLGRKPLWIIGSVGMAFGISGIGFAAYFQYTGVGALISMLIFIGSFAMSLGPVTWVLLSEIFPNKVRGKAMSIAVAAQWISNFLVSLSFPMMNENPYLLEKFNGGFPFWVYGILCLGSIAFGILVIPETKGKTLEEMEALWLPRDQDKQQGQAAG